MAAEFQVKNPHRSSSHVLQAKRREAEKGKGNIFKKIEECSRRPGVRNGLKRKKLDGKSGEIERSGEVKRAQGAERAFGFQYCSKGRTEHLQCFSMYTNLNISTVGKLF